MMSPQIRKQRMSSMLEAKISGIPCLIDVTRCDITPGSYNYNAASDWDYYGTSEVEFDVYDRKGYRAAWLQKKLTDDEDCKIVNLIVNSSNDD